ncbi:RICIN domain-containing protein [Streptomyces sp. 6N223]|uniref:RICIN domain-containing protein n=1 Tax=Streptomyces sp. 6N223 TaxID=3457412 RepID=UPI003FD39E23
MSLWTSLEPASATVEPGDSTRVRLRVRNTGDVVDEYRFEPVGDLAPWTRVEPPTLRLYPGTTGTVELTFAPPRTPDATAGPNPYAVRITPTEHPDAVTVPEGNLTILPFTEVRAELVPVTVKGRFRGKPRFAVDNLGNTPLTASISGSDNGDQLSYEIRPSNVQIQPGRAAFVKGRLTPQQITWIGSKEERPYTFAVRRSGADPLRVDGTYVQRGVLPRWGVTFLGVVLTLAVIFAVLWFAYQPKVTSAATATQEAGGTLPPEPETEPTLEEPTEEPTEEEPTEEPTEEEPTEEPTDKPETEPPPEDESQLLSGEVYRLHAGNGGCLDMGPGDSDGDNVQLWSCNDSLAQQFTIQSHGSDTYTLHAKGLCLDVANASTDSGANVQMAYCSGVAAQDWRFAPRGDGTYQLVAAVSGHCLDVVDGRTEDGTNVRQWDCNGAPAQEWTIERL